MKERDLNTTLNHLLHAYIDYTMAYELKISHSLSVPFSALKEHQERNLLQAKTGKIVFKIPDLGLQNLFDGFVLCTIPAFVILCFYVPRESKNFLLIDIQRWIEEKELSERKSITKKRAIEIASLILKA